MSEVHLLVLIHGMWGNPNHLSELARIISEKASTGDGSTLHVLTAKTNSDESTYDGIDWGGERVAQEVIDEVEDLQKQGKTVTRFSVTGYSLGGLLARYVVGILHQRNFFDEVTPVNFNTFATPHIGLLKYPSLISSVFSSLGPKLLSRTGEQFYGVDKWGSSQQPLIEVMADPDRIFWQAIALFLHIRIYANAVNDVTVPFITASISTSDPFLDHNMNGIQIEIDETYSPLIKSYSLPAYPPAPTPKPVVLSPKWFKSLKPERPLLPPFLTFPFPFNVLFYALLPLLVPGFVSLVLVRLSLAARSSRVRIKKLERDESRGERLIHILSQLEKQVEDAVVDMLDEPGPQSESSEENEELSHKSKEKKTQKPILSAMQVKIAAALNKLPNLRKEFVFIHPVRNSHAVIVCRDVKRFASHKMGEGAVRHWADVFVM